MRVSRAALWTPGSASNCSSCRAEHKWEGSGPGSWAAPPTLCTCPQALGLAVMAADMEPLCLKSRCSWWSCVITHICNLSEFPFSNGQRDPQNPNCCLDPLTESGQKHFTNVYEGGGRSPEQLCPHPPPTTIPQRVVFLGKLPTWPAISLCLVTTPNPPESTSKGQQAAPSALH